MKRFLLLLLIFISPVILTLIATELLLRKIPNEYSIKKDYLDENSNQIEILVLGSSHTYIGVNPEFISGNAYNAALVSQSLDYDFEILKKYNGEWDSLKTIVLPISYFSLYFNLENGVESWRVKNYNFYFDLHKGGKWKYFTEIFNTPFENNIKRIYKYYLRRNSFKIPTSNLGWGYQSAKQKPKRMEEKGKVAAERHTQKSDYLFKSNVYHLKNILTLAEQNNWNVLLVTPPAYYTYRKYLNQNQLNSTIDIISNSSLLFENVKYYNLIDSPKFLKEDFYDADHLNGKGTAKFSILLNNLIHEKFN